jgi:hypothetical protein
MSLLEQASLVITPNAVEEGKLFSIKPTDGSGDLSAVRATTATEVGSDGLIQNVPYNLASYSEQFNNVIWQKSNAVVTANDIIAPNGTLTADKLVLNGPFSAWRLNFVYQAGITYTLSFWGKKDGLGVGLNVRDNTNNVIYGTYNLTNDWARYSFTFTPTTTSTLLYWGIKGAEATNDIIYIWGAQLVTGTEPKEYFPTTDRLNVPRLDYSTGSCPSILVEPQRTNLATYSEDFTDSSWNKITSGASVSTPIVTANSAISPDGTMNADLIEFTPPSDSNYSICQKIISFNNSLNGSIYLKAFDESQVGKKVGIYIVKFGNIQGTVLTLTNEWQRVIISRPTDVYIEFTFGKGRTTWATGGITQSESASKFYAWGAQLEVGANATSYIPTVASAVTRNADVISKTGISDFFNNNTGTLFLDFTSLSVSSTTLVGFSIFDTTSSQSRFLFSTGIGYTIAGVGSFNLGDNILNKKYKVAIVYGVGVIKLFCNGVLISSINANLPFTLNQIYYNSSMTLKYSLNFITENILSDQECINLTTL